MPAPRVVPKSSGTSLRILLAEDNIVNARIARAILERAGHAVTIAGNGTAAIAAVENAVFDLVLMDVEMPEMNGTDATAAIRRRERAKGGHMPIIALTAYCQKGGRERCIDAGADGYVPKPIVRGDLFGEIDSVLATNGNPLHHADTGVVFSHTDLLGRVDGNQALLEEVVDLFVHDVPRLMGSIKQAIDTGDTEALYNAAHTLKGSAGNFGAEKVTLTAERLEVRAKEQDLRTAAQVFITLEAEIDRLVKALTVHHHKAAVRCAS
jgi:two-component system, sensor histidine kinase and response regulator